MLNFSAIGRAWTNGNNISSDGETSQVMLPDLDEGATELFGRLVRIDGKARLGGIFDYQPILPGRHVTQDGFDQVEAYYSLDSVLNYLNTLGIDPQQIIGSQHKGIPHPVVAHVNAVDDLNAWYAPEDDDLTFGTNGDMSKGQDKWHLASDSDVTVHEMGHLLLDHMNKRLGGWMNNSQNVKRMGDPGDDDEPGAEANEGLAIHEAFGDLLSAFYFDDPEMGEDFSPSIGQPPSKKSGLRNVENNATLDKVGNEPHDRSLAYSGFFWSVKKDLSDPNGPFKLTSRQASDVALKLLFNHAGNYGTANPTSADFVKAVLAGTDALAASGQLGVDPQALKSVIGAESYRRKLISGQPNAFMAKRGPRSFDELKSMVGTSGAFTLDQRSAFFGGTQEIYSQQYVTSKGQRVDVLGGNGVQC